MEIDRALFLSCVAALAAVTCVPNQDRSPANARTVDVPASPDASPRVEIDRDAGPACDELVDAPAKCDALKPPGPSCESFTDTVESCKRTAKVLRPAAADRVVRWLLARNKTEELCSLFRRGNPVAFAFGDSLDKTCRDPEADDRCQKLVMRLPKKEFKYREASELVTTCRSAVAAMRDPALMLKCLDDPEMSQVRFDTVHCYEWLEGRTETAR